MPARAAYAAALAEVLPVDAQMTALAPCAAATVIAVVIPRSLKDPVGLSPSTLRYTSQPVRADSTGAGSSGVPPSWRVTGRIPATVGSRSRYSVMIPRHGIRAWVTEALVTIALAIGNAARMPRPSGLGNTAPPLQNRY